MHRSPSRRALSLSLLLAACGGGGTEAIKTGFDDTGADVDEDPPEVTHEQLGTQLFGQAALVQATVVDLESEIGEVKVFYRRNDVTTWSELALTPAGDDLFGVQIPGDEVSGSGMKYYLTAADVVGNTVAYPIEGEALPLDFRVSAD